MAIDRAFLIANFCDDESDIQRILGPIEACPSKYADGTIKTKPIFRDYAKALLKKNTSVEELQQQVLSQQKQITLLEKQIEKLTNKMEKLIHLFVDNESDMDSDSDSDSESDSDSDSDSD